MAKKAPIYTECNIRVDEDLISLLNDACDNLVVNCRPNVPISKAGARVGYGVDKAKRSIAADNLISIAKQIKARPGW
jgi:hypothetical protein